MAITKIQCLNEAHTGNPAAHLKNALSYIQNPEKTEENVLVGSINCLPDTAFEQMMDTKVTFGKTNKRQGYHIIISFAPGEATEEKALDIVARFAQEYLKDKYEAVYAVHNDKKHMHGHIVFNSVSFETGMKHECKKGEWKHRMQPITNRLCKEYGLSIVPAEYVKEPKNLSRKEWECEQCFRKMILADAEFCQSQAGSFDHFIFLMKRIGYQFEYGKYLSVKVPGGKWYHELDKLDERFSEEKFRFYLDMSFTRPGFVVGNTVAIHKRGITDFQMKYYRRIYQARMVEQRRFDKHSAYLAKELERMNQLQEQYLFLVNNNIKTVEGLVTYQVLGERDVEKISERQQELYQQNRARRRVCKTEEDIRDYQIWHMGVQEKLNELKAEKKAINKKLKIAEGCVQEYKKFSMLDFSTIEDEIRNSIEVPEYPYAEEKNIALSVNDAVSDMGMDGVSVMNESENYETSLGAEVCEQISAEDTMDATVGDASEANIVEEYVDDWSDDKGNYETYKKMTSMEKAQMHGFRELKSYDTVRSIVQMKFLDMGHIADVDELLEETDLLYKGMCELVVKNKTEEVLDEIKQRGIAFDDLSVIEKARMLQFQPDNNSYNIQLYSAVCKACGVDTSDEDKIFEDYQAVYEKTLEMQPEWSVERKDGGSERAR
uniref:relaxase/mobilization nuclease domain-containing protein n=1 Tax=[Lactobacillus] rogosae TaxID=706562 RepID=UPI00402A95B0